MTPPRGFALLAKKVEDARVGSLDPELASLLLAIEDRRFRRHRGVDLRSMTRAIWGLASRRPRGGGSTIDMQLVRTLTNRYERTIRRKLVEIVFAVRLRHRFGPERILRTYAAVAYCGEGVVGFAAAAERMFHRPIAACSLHQKAVVAALLLHPIPRRPTRRWRRLVAGRARRAMGLVRAGQPFARFSVPAP